MLPIIFATIPVNYSIGNIYNNISIIPLETNICACLGLGFDTIVDNIYNVCIIDFLLIKFCNK